MGVFDINGKFFKTLTKAGDFIILTLLAMVCSIPVITIGASLTAVFYAALKMARDEEGYVWKEFFKSFKQNLKQSILIELILAAFAAILLVDINVCAKWAADGGGTLVQLLMFAAIGILIVLAAVVLMLFGLFILCPKKETFLCQFGKNTIGIYILHRLFKDFLIYGGFYELLSANGYLAVLEIMVVSLLLTFLFGTAFWADIIKKLSRVSVRRLYS